VAFYTLHTLCVERKAQGVPTYVAFLDFKTAFPLTYQPLVQNQLWAAGIRGPLWRICRELYGSAKSRVIHPLVEEEDFIDVEQGLREGSKLSPLLFEVAINDFPEYIQCGEGNDVHLGPPLLPSNGAYVGAPLFADDACLVGGSPDELRQMIHRAQAFSRTRGLTINLAKCAVLEVHPRSSSVPPPNVYKFIDPATNTPVPVPVVTSFKYLGFYIDAALDSSKLLKHTRQMFWYAFQRAQRLGMRQWALDMVGRAHLWKSVVLPQIQPVLPFLSEQQTATLQSDVNRSLRAVFCQTACSSALSAEFGVLPLSALRLRGLLKLYGNLQSPGMKLLGALLHARRDPHPPTSHCLDARFAKALTQTGLAEHAPSINTDLLQITRQRDNEALRHPSPHASPAFPFRHAWDLTLRWATEQWAQQQLKSTAE